MPDQRIRRNTQVGGILESQDSAASELAHSAESGIDMAESRSRKPERPDGDAGLGRTSVSQIYRGRARLALIRDLALGEWTAISLARQLGLPPDDVIQFEKEFSQEIQEVKQALAGQLAIETSGLWITKKQNRLAELQEEFEQIDSATSALRDGGLAWSRAQKDMVTAKIALLRAVADELGAYPQRTSAPAQTGNTVHYIIETDDVSALR